MKITVLYFAQAARAAGTERESLEADGPLSLGALRELVLRKYPELAAMAGSLLWSVDEEMASPALELRSGQTVGVMPPFSGG